VSYGAFVTLLLAFFITLQAFGMKQSAGLFYTGQGSFIRSLQDFGLGRFWVVRGNAVSFGSGAPKYLATEGLESPPAERSIDPEFESAQEALHDLAVQFEVRDPKCSGWKVVLSTPLTFGGGKTQLSSNEREFLKGFARRVVPSVLNGGYVIGVGAYFVSSDEREPELTEFASQSLEQVRRELLDNMAGEVRKRGATRIYSYARRVAEDEQHADLEEDKLAFDIVLTKPPVEAEETGG